MNLADSGTGDGAVQGKAEGAGLELAVVVVGKPGKAYRD